MTERLPFRDRADAGRRLAAQLAGYRGRPDVLVLALPRGGVPVAAEVADALGAPLDVFLVRKVGVPYHRELAMGAIAEGDTTVLNDDVVRTLRIPRAEIDRVVAEEQGELVRRQRLYRGTSPLPNAAHRTAILIDDGLATGSTMEAAVVALRKLDASRVVVAVPVGARESCARLRRMADEVVCLATPKPFEAVGLWYEDFSETTDDDVQRLLVAARLARVTPRTAS
jgi:putative phosphoribosyl transferase